MFHGQGETRVTVWLGHPVLGGFRMSRATVSYVCNECGGHTLKWQGQCPACGAWNSLVAGAAAPSKGSGYAGEIKGLKLAEVEQADVERFSTGISEFDRVLGGGLVTGSVVLIGGEPGIGKSTLLLQAAGSQPTELAGALC